MLLSLNNLFYYQDLMQGMRTAIAERRFDDFCAATRDGWARGDTGID
jgi:queuine tRNA-ribosyltransferase